MAALLYATACRKKGTVNTPPEVYFFKKKNGGSVLSKAAALLLSKGTLNHLPHDGFFLFAAGQFIFIIIVQRLE